MKLRSSKRLTCILVTCVLGLTSWAETDGAVAVRPSYLFFAGDSTLDDHGASLGGEALDPYRSWGTALQSRMIGSHRVANYARSGASTKSFMASGIWTNLLAHVRARDYVAIQFGHNDQKRSTEFYRNERWADPKGLFRENIRLMVGEVREMGATPILLSPICRGTFDKEGRKLVDSEHRSDGVCLGSYRDAMSELAQELDCDYVDMNGLTRELMEKIGKNESMKFFVISTGLVKGKDGEPSKDTTHPVQAGAEAFAKLFVDDVRERRLPVAALFCAAAEQPEITWSVMHPTAIDTNYMARVVAKAKAYGGVDSFEVCGDCHSPYGGINGLSMLDPYPHAHAALDPKLVAKSRAELSAICDLAHSIGRPLYYWHREVFLAKGLLEDRPEMLDENGEFDLLGKSYQDYLRFKIREAFRYCPKLDGVALTLTEADYSVIHSSRPDRYPPQRVVEELVGIFAEEHERLGKRFILRSFGSNSQDYTDIIGGAKRAAAKHGFEIETKVTEADFVPWLPKNPFLKKTPPLKLGVECDALGEYLGAGYLPAAQVGRIREYVGYGREEGADRYTIRIDRVGNSIFDSAHEVNLYAYMRFIRDPSATADGVIGEYATKHFGAAAADMMPILKHELELVRNIHYVASNLTFHSFPLKPDFKWLKSGGIYSVYRENAELFGAKDIWSILHWMRAPSHERILAEKDAGLAFATNALATIERLEGRMPADEYARQHRAFVIAAKAARALRAYTRCVVAYFEDMAAKLDRPFRLEAASQTAVVEIESMMSDVNDKYDGSGAYFATVGDNLDRVYFIGLRFYCRELLREYRIERAMRRRLERPDVCDFVIPGGIYDDNRTIRTMHGAHAATKIDRVVRYAGNDVFPNGTITVGLKGPSDARVDVALDPDGAQECSVEKNWKDGVWTVAVGKKGAGYPGILSIALLSGENRKRMTADVSFARGKWNPSDFELAKSWRWNHLGGFVQRDDMIVNDVPVELTPEEVYRKCHDSSYAALVHKGVFALGSTVSSKMMFDYRMAPIVVLAPELGVSAAGVPEFRDHWEICLYDRGINVWYHWFENGRQRWHKAAAFELPADESFKAGVPHDVSVRVERYPRHPDLKQMTVTCDGRKFSYVDERLPETFRAGIIACEGRNFFYDFKVR